jgi:adenylate kinase
MGEVCDDDGKQLAVRSDDYPEAIEKRLSEYREKVVPVVEVYKKRGILLEIDAKPSIEDVWDSVLTAMKDR